MRTLLALAFSFVMLLALRPSCMGSVKQRLRTFQQGESFIVSVRFTPDGSRLVSASLDGTVAMWEMRSGRRLWQTSFDQRPNVKRDFTITHVMDMDLSPDGRTIAVSYYRRQVVNNTLVGKDDERLVLLDAQSGEERRVLVAHNAMPRGLAFSPDGRSLMCVGADRTARLWSLAEGKELWSMKLKSKPVAVAYSLDGEFVAIGIEAGSDAEPVGLYEAETGRPVASFPPARRNVVGVTFLPNSHLLAIASNDAGAAQVDVWDITDNKLKRTIKDDTGITFSPDGRLRASSGSLYEHGIVVVRDVGTNEKRVTRKLPADLSASDFSSDSKTLAVGTEKGQIVLIPL